MKIRFITLLIIFLSVEGLSAQSEFLPRGKDAFTIVVGYAGNEDTKGVIGGASLSFNGILDLTGQIARLGSGDSSRFSISPSVTWHFLKSHLSSPTSLALRVGYQNISSDNLSKDYYSIGLGLFINTSDQSGFTFNFKAGISYSVDVSMIQYYEVDTRRDPLVMGQVGIGLIFGSNDNRFMITPEVAWSENGATIGILCGLVLARDHNK